MYSWQVSRPIYYIKKLKVVEREKGNTTVEVIKLTSESSGEVRKGWGN